MNSVYIIAEAGVNHNGRLDLAYALIDAAKQSGADAVKFQTFRTEKIVTRQTSMAEYQKKNLSSEESQFMMLKALELGYDAFAGLKRYAEQAGIDFLSTPDDEESLDFLCEELQLPLIKIGSGEVTNLPFLRNIAAKGKAMILSTGMSTLGEVEKAVHVLQEESTQDISLLHCTTNYPCPPEEVNLRAMLTLKESFRLRVGYSDHTLGSEVSVAAAALGAEIIEKHLTLDTSMEGPDHRASLDPGGLADMVRQIRVVEKALGSGIKWPNRSEERIRAVVRRKVIAARDLAAGTVLDWEHLCFKRSDHGIRVEQAEQIIGTRLITAIREDNPVCWQNIEFIT